MDCTYRDGTSSLWKLAREPHLSISCCLGSMTALHFHIAPIPDLPWNHERQNAKFTKFIPGSIEELNMGNKEWVASHRKYLWVSWTYRVMYVPCYVIFKFAVEHFCCCTGLATFWNCISTRWKTPCKDRLPGNKKKQIEFDCWKHVYETNIFLWKKYIWFSGADTLIKIEFGNLRKIKQQRGKFCGTLNKSHGKCLMKISATFYMIGGPTK